MNQIENRLRSERSESGKRGPGAAAGGTEVAEEAKRVQTRRSRVALTHRKRKATSEIGTAVKMFSSDF